MITYKYNLTGKFSPEEYDKVAKKALRLTRSASAVDTGLYRRSWRVRVTGDFLFVSNSLRYAAPVELGSSVHKKHKHKIRNALAFLGSGSVSVGAGTSTGFTSGKAPSQTPSQAPSQTPKAVPLTVAELRAPALLLNRFKPQKVVVPSLPSGRPTITKTQLFNREYLLAAIAAAALLKEEEVEEEEEIE
jgi:hypothetical protein